MTKVCKGCGKELPIESFSKTGKSDHKGGRRNYCGPCVYWMRGKAHKEKYRLRLKREQVAVIAQGNKDRKRPNLEPRPDVLEAIEFIRETCKRQGYITTLELMRVKLFAKRDAIAWLTDNDTLYEDDRGYRPEWYSFLWANNPKIVDKVRVVV